MVTANATLKRHDFIDDTSMKSLLIALISLIYAPVALAGYLTIGGSSNLTASLNGSTVLLRGTYTITNTGDEQAHRVFPSFQLGTFTYSGEPKSVGVNGEERWEIKADIDLKNIAGGETSPNAVKGMYPLLIRRHYEDANGAKFSAPDVELLPLGNLTEQELGTVRTPRLTPLVSCDGNGETFTCKLEILNTGDDSYKVHTFYHTTMEIQGVTPPGDIEVPARDQASWSFDLKNFSGLPGSSYGVFAILEWQDGPLHFAERAGSLVSVKRVSYQSYYIAAGISLFLLAALATYLFVFREKKSS